MSVHEARQNRHVGGINNPFCSRSQVLWRQTAADRTYAIAIDPHPTRRVDGAGAVHREN